MRLPPFQVEALSDHLLLDGIVPPNVSMTNAPALWAKGFTGKGIVVAVLDSGVDTTHPDFVGDKFFPMINLVNDKNYDEYGHGTHVTGTIAANGAIKGVAPECKVLPVKIFGAEGYGPDWLLVEAYRRARLWRGPNGEKVDIISASIGGAANLPELHEEIQACIAAGISLPTAAGNDGDGNPWTAEYSYPGAYQECIQVSAINLNGLLTEFSNTNERVDFAQVGEHVQSTWPTNLGARYGVLSGTSMATPAEAGREAIARQMFRAIKQRVWQSEDEIWQFYCTMVKELNLPVTAQGRGLGYLLPELLPVAIEVPMYLKNEPEAFEPQVSAIMTRLRDGEDAEAVIRAVFGAMLFYRLQFGAFKVKANRDRYADTIQAILEKGGATVRRIG